LIEKDVLRFSKTPKLQRPSLIVGWSRDAGKLGIKVIDFLNEELGSEEFCQIKPTGFFSLGGVEVENDVVQFPESTFYFCGRKNLMILKSSEPQYEWYKFMNSVLDVAEMFNTKIFYTIGGTISLISHTSPRRIFTVFNQPELKRVFQDFGLVDMDYEGEPALSSYLLWAAKKRNIPGVSLWVEIPFYLARVEDPTSWKRVLEFFNQKFSLGIDLEEISQDIKTQNEEIYKLRRTKPAIDKYLSQLESGFMLNEKEQEKLVKEIYQSLKEYE
jgi:proteasome assembly chaperone (PAC2) family protein